MKASRLEYKGFLGYKSLWVSGILQGKPYGLPFVLSSACVGTAQCAVPTGVVEETYRSQHSSWNTRIFKV